MSARKSLARKLGIGFVTLILAALCGEIAARALHLAKIPRLAKRDGGQWYDLVHRPASTPGLAYELVPGLERESLGVHLRTNSLGMRDDEPLPADTPGLFRVVALGDSVTFAYRVEAEQGFCALLEQALAASPLGAGRRVEVLDTGVSGYSTHDEVAALEGKWLAFDPRLVLVCYSLNDPEVVPNQPLTRYFVPAPWWHASRLLLAIQQRLTGRRIAALGGGNYFRYLHADGTPSWESVQTAFARLAELARAHGFRVVVVVFPTFSFDPWSAYQFRAEHAKVVREAERNGFLALDLLPRFESEEPRSVTIEADDPHPTALGHAIAAAEILKFLEGHPELFAPAGK